MSGVFFLIAVGDEWKKTLKLSGECPIEVITYVKTPYDQSTRY
jgi:hypothetical protein